MVGEEDAFQLQERDVLVALHAIASHFLKNKSLCLPCC